MLVLGGVEDVSFDILNSGYFRDVRADMQPCSDGNMRTVIEVCPILIATSVSPDKAYPVFQVGVSIF